MNETECAAVREFLPGFATNRLELRDAEYVEAHLPGCAECREELELVQSLFAARPQPPVDPAEQILAGVHAERRGKRPSWWGISAAAVAALAIGVGIASDPEAVPIEASEYLTELAEGDLWLSDGGLVAGAPTLEGLSDEALEALFDELTAGSTGGAV
jgi:predicted anti-sigma-YlaC factor YlaD